MTLKNDLIYALIVVALAIIFGLSNNALKPTDQQLPESKRQLPWLGSPSTPDQVKEQNP